MAFRLPPRPLNPVTLPRIKRETVRSSDHLNFIRSLPCTVTGAYDGIQAAHVSYVDLRYGKTGRAYGRKESDCWTVPLCSDQHTLQHGMNEREFWQLAGIDPCRVAVSLYLCTGDRDLALVVLQHARD